MRIRDYPCLSLPPLFLPSPFSETFDRDSPPSFPEKEEVRFQVMRFPGKSRKRERGATFEITACLRRIQWINDSARCITLKLRPKKSSTKPRLSGELIPPLPPGLRIILLSLLPPPSSCEQVASLSLSPRTRRRTESGGGDSLDRLQAGTK